MSGGLIYCFLLLYLKVIFFYHLQAHRDFVPASNLPLRFVSGQSANNMPIQCTELSVLDDNILEYDETFTVRLSSRSNQVYITTGREEAEIIIREDDTDCE